MKLAIFAPGLRGDVQPHVALGCGLVRAGHDVVIGTHAEFEPLVRGRGLGFAPVAGNPRKLIGTDTGQAWLASGRDPIAFARHMARLAEPLIEQVLADAERACTGADVVLFSAIGFNGADLAEHLGVPSCGAYLQPMTRTRERPAIFWPFAGSLGPIGNRLTHLLQEQLLWRPLASAVNRGRRDHLGLPALRWGPWQRLHHEVPALYAFSPAVLPRPRDWPPGHHVTGYWFLDRMPDWRPPDEVVDFLADGPPPIYVGFGSMAPADAERLTGIAVEALARVGRRGLIVGGWAGLGRAVGSDRVLVTDAIPHDWLFPRMAAVVHHGGAGTTAAGLRAGVPTVAVPFFAEQPFWASRVHALGAGPRPIPRRRLTVDRLADAMRVAVEDDGIRSRAGRLGEQIRAEDGVGRAVELLRLHLSAPLRRDRAVVEIGARGDAPSRA